MPTTVASNQDVEKLLEEQLSQAGTRALPIASVVMEPPQAWITQCDLFEKDLQLQGTYAGTDSKIANHVQVRQAIAHAIGLGFKGFLFRSTMALDSGYESDMARARSSGAINAEIELLRPWIESGQAPQRINGITNNLFNGKSISTERSMLLIFNTQGLFDRIAPVSPHGSNLEFSFPRRNMGEQVYRITHGTIESIPLAPRPEGWSLRITNPSVTEYLVVTNDAVVLQYLQRALQDFAMNVTSHRVEAAANHLALAQSSLHQEGIVTSDAWWTRLQSAEALLRSASTNHAQNNLPLAIRDSERSLNESLAVLRSCWLRANDGFQDPRSSPFLANLSSLPLHWQLRRLIRNREWENHEIPGKEFIDLNQMSSVGWSHGRRLTDRVQHQFAVADQVGIDRTAAMVVAAAPIHGDRIPGGFAGSTMQVRSGELPVYPGRVIRLSGKVRVDQPSNELLAGLLCSDTFGGSSLGQPIAADSSTVGRWQEFELYRVVRTDKTLQLLIDVQGALAATVDDVQLQSVSITPANVNFITTPVPSVNSR